MRLFEAINSVIDFETSLADKLMLDNIWHVIYHKRLTIAAIGLTPLFNILVKLENLSPATLSYPVTTVSQQQQYGDIIYQTQLSLTFLVLEYNMEDKYEQRVSKIARFFEGIERKYHEQKVELRYTVMHLRAMAKFNRKQMSPLSSGRVLLHQSFLHSSSRLLEAKLLLH